MTIPHTRIISLCCKYNAIAAFAWQPEQDALLGDSYGESVHSGMIIRSVRHRGLLRLLEDDDSRELRNDLVFRLRNILAVLIAVADMGGVVGPPGWRVHQFRGDRAGTWSISVSGNWRPTFDIRQSEICNLDLEDYH